MVDSIPVMKQLAQDIKDMINSIHEEFGKHSLVVSD